MSASFCIFSSGRSRYNYFRYEDILFLRFNAYLAKKGESWEAEFVLRDNPSNTIIVKDMQQSDVDASIASYSEAEEKYNNTLVAISEAKRTTFEGSKKRKSDE
jgi:hypothetical protein